METRALDVAHRSIDLLGARVFYREAGPRSAPTLLLLHGFPSSSHMFRRLIVALADRWHVVAPDYPGFGFSDALDASFRPGFASYASLMRALLDALGVERFTVYLQDYGAPVGLRLALLAPERVSGLIVQNGNAYAEGLSEAWAPLQTYWAEPTGARRAELAGWLEPQALKVHYLGGLSTEQVELVSPDTWALDAYHLARPGRRDLQLDLFLDYRDNVALYPDFQRFFRDRKPPTLITWGRHDPFFTLAGALAYRRDLPDAELHVLDAGHFALETHGRQIAEHIRSFPFDR